MEIVTREHLLNMHNDIQQAKQYAPGLTYLLRSRIDDFYRGSGQKRGNGTEINNTIMKQTKLQEEYLEITDEEKPQIKMTEAIPAIPAKTEKNEEGEYIEIEPAIPAQPAQPIMKEGKTYEEFDAKWKKLMSENVNVY